MNDFATINMGTVEMGDVDLSSLCYRILTEASFPWIVGIYLANSSIVKYYVLGESLNTSGLLVMATDSVGTTSIVKDYSLSGFDSEIEGVKTVVVAYNGFACSFEVGVTNVVDNNDKIMLDKENRLIIL